MTTFFKGHSGARQDECDVLPASGLLAPVLHAAAQHATETTQGPDHDFVGPIPTQRIILSYAKKSELLRIGS
jgi:hypothetical protein